MRQKLIRKTAEHLVAFTSMVFVFVYYFELRSKCFIQISKIKKSLLSSVEAEGENFSVGEKQLMCLTRAILRKNKVKLHLLQILGKM